MHLATTMLIYYSLYISVVRQGKFLLLFGSYIKVKLSEWLTISVDYFTLAHFVTIFKYNKI